MIETEFEKDAGIVEVLRLRDEEMLLVVLLLGEVEGVWVGVEVGEGVGVGVVW